MKYTVRKKDLVKKEIKFIYIFFDNGDFVSIDGTELTNISVGIYDRLVRHGDGFCAVAQAGCFEFKIDEQNKHELKSFVHDPHAFNSDRKRYIEHRCLSESRITEIRFFDELNWDHRLLGNFNAETDGNTLRLVIVSQPQMGGASSNEHTIMLGEIEKEDVCSLDLIFENCESLTVFNNEIKEIDLIFEKELEWGSSKFYRCVKEGYIKLKLRKDLSRASNLFGVKSLKRKNMERRLCGKGGCSTHDICRLHFNLYHAGYGDKLCESIECEEIKPQKEVERLIKREEHDNAVHYMFESGYAKLLKDRTVVLTFGSNAKRSLKAFC